MRPLHRLLTVALLAALMTTGPMCDPPHVWAGGDDQACCPKCKCSVSKEAVKKHCYGVECKTICIPRITFPWQTVCRHVGDAVCDGGCEEGCDGSCTSCPSPLNGAKLKTVRILKKFEYTCERCKYRWTPTRSRCDDADRDCTATPDSVGPQRVPPVPSTTKSAAQTKEPGSSPSVRTSEASTRNRLHQPKLRWSR